MDGGEAAVGYESVQTVKVTKGKEERKANGLTDLVDLLSIV